MYKVHNLNKYFADIDLSEGCDRFDLIPSDDLMIDRQGKIVRLGIKNAAALLTLTNLYSVMLYVERSAVSRSAKLIWSFSSIAVVVADLRPLLDRWDETGEPPILSIIALDIGDNRHLTRGLWAFVGYELAVKFDAPLQSRDGARNLVRLARYAIMNGGLTDEAVYQAIDGKALRLDWSERGKPTALVTILL